MTRAEHVSTITGAALAVGLTIWATAQPILPYVSPTWFCVSGEILGLGLGLVYLVHAQLLTSRSAQIFAHAVFGLGMAFVIWTSTLAFWRADRVAARCATIERGMLHPNAKTRGDLPAVFQAMGCRPGTE